MRPLITVTAVVLLHLCVIAVLVGVNGCRSTSGFEQSGDLAAYSGGARPAGTTAGLPVAVAPISDRIPTPVPTKLTPVGPVGNGGKRTVVKGETLMSIAASEKVTRADLAKANGLTLNAVLKTGQVLTIPSASASSAAPKAAAPKAAAPAPAPSFAPLKLVPLTGSAPAPVAAPDKK